MTNDRFQADGPADHGACQPPSAGTVSGAPRNWLRAEAAVLLVGTLAAYSTTGQPWWLVPALILLPDLAWAGYLGGTRIGAVIYNAAHATPLPAVMIGLGWWQHRPLIVALGLVWLAHIGLDRLLGYGLKHDDRFQHTHLGTGQTKGRLMIPFDYIRAGLNTSGVLASSAELADEGGIGSVSLAALAERLVVKAHPASAKPSSPASPITGPDPSSASPRPDTNRGRTRSTSGYDPGPDGSHTERWWRYLPLTRTHCEPCASRPRGGLRTGRSEAADSPG